MQRLSHEQRPSPGRHERMVCLGGGVQQRAHDGRHNVLDFRVLDDRANLVQCLLSSLLHFLVRVREDLNKLWYNPGKARRELLRCAVCHGSKELRRRIAFCARYQPGVSRVMQEAQA